MRILNLYAGVGGNRRLWGDEHEVVAVEYDRHIATAYAGQHPNDELIVGDAHEYLLNHYSEFDYIWSSPPCQSHSRMRYHLGVGAKGFDFKYPDMSLYEEILLLQNQLRKDQRFTVENVIPWYTPLIPAQKLHRHLYWADFNIPEQPHVHESLRTIQIDDLQQMHGIRLERYYLPDRRQVLRNMVSPVAGLHIFNAMRASLPDAGAING